MPAASQAAVRPGRAGWPPAWQRRAASGTSARPAALGCAAGIVHPHRHPAAPVDVDLARRQHAAYRAALAAAGWEVVDVEPADDCPDSVFVEDTLVVCDGLAVVTRPGAPERRPEVDAAERAARALGLDTVRIDGARHARRRRRAAGGRHGLRGASAGAPTTPASSSSATCWPPAAAPSSAYPCAVSCT